MKLVLLVLQILIVQISPTLRERYLVLINKVNPPPPTLSRYCISGSFQMFYMAIVLYAPSLALNAGEYTI